MILQKYFAALLSFAIVVLTAFLAIPTGQINGAAIVQLISIGSAAVLTYWLPLVDIKWKGILKTGVAVIAAVISVVWPIVQAGGVPNSTQIALMVLAALNAAAVEMGVQVRLDSNAVTPEVAANTEAVHELTGAVKQIAAAPSLTTAPVATQPEPAPEPTPVAADPSTVWIDTTPEPAPVTVEPHPANTADEQPAHTVSVNVANLVGE